MHKLMKMYRDFVMELYDESICKNELECFRKIIKTKLLSYYPCPKSGSMFYNSSILSDSSLKLVYKLLNRVDRKLLILIIEKYLMNVMEEID